MTVSQAIALLTERIQSELLVNVINILVTIAPIFLAIILFVIFWDLWVRYVRSKQVFSTKYVVLELKLPKDTFKSPQAMEVFLQSLHNTADGSEYAQYWKGETRPWYSLEIVSIEGTVKFFIWAEEQRKAGIMSALYSQFPEIEIREIEDYTKSIHADPKVTRIWGAEFMFTKDNAYPIKTYIDYGLDKDPKEEFKVDPMLPLLEFLGSVPVNQQVWIQILIMAHKKQRKSKDWFRKTDPWEDEAKEIVNKILIRDKVTKVAGEKIEGTNFTRMPSISKGEEEIASAVERSQMKHPFDVGIRALYIAPKDEFSTPFGVGGIISSFKHFSSNQLNGFKGNTKKWHPRLDNPWQDFHNMRRNRYGRLVLDAYKRRSYFFPPFKGVPMVMNTEELATIYHFPGSVSATPNLTRVPSKKAEAPANLPV
ncbi:MAG: hypothetical protein AAB777_01655 [Patescibacteria group bacterium]